MLLRSRGGRVLKGPRLAPGAAPPQIPGGCLGSGAPGFSLPLAGAPQLLEVWALRHGKLYVVGKLLLRAVQNGPTCTLWGSSSLRFTSCSLHKPGLCSSKQGQSEGNFWFFFVLLESNTTHSHGPHEVSVCAGITALGAPSSSQQSLLPRDVLKKTQTDTNLVTACPQQSRGVPAVPLQSSGKAARVQPAGVSRLLVPIACFPRTLFCIISVLSPGRFMFLYCPRRPDKAIKMSGCP